MSTSFIGPHGQALLDSMKHQPFMATAFSHYYGGNEYDVSAVLSSDKGEPAVRVTTDHDYIYITKAQAMAFFGLVEPTKSTSEAQGFIPKQP